MGLFKVRVTVESVTPAAGSDACLLVCGTCVPLLCVMGSNSVVLEAFLPKV